MPARFSHARWACGAPGIGPTRGGAPCERDAYVSNGCGCESRQGRQARQVVRWSAHRRSARFLAQRAWRHVEVREHTRASAVLHAARRRPSSSSRRSTRWDVCRCSTRRRATVRCLARGRAISASGSRSTATRCEAGDYESISGDLQRAYPMLRKLGVQFPQIVANPPFGLNWTDGAGRRRTAPSPAWRMSLGLLGAARRRCVHLRARPLSPRGALARGRGGRVRHGRVRGPVRWHGAAGA